MNAISIIGNGNVATHLFRALKDKADVRIVNSRTLEGLPEHSDLILIAVKDDVIEEIASKVKGKGDIIAHTSGSVPANVLEGTAGRFGVFYPMQTFSKDVGLNYEEIPFFIEGSDVEAEDALKSYAGLISDNVNVADSDDRRQLHLAAVFACNFTNALVGAADDILRERGMDYKVMLPLLKQTVGKLETLTPEEAQTGPASRHDMNVLEKHMKMLEDKPLLREIYSGISDLILRKGKL